MGTIDKSRQGEFIRLLVQSARILELVPGSQQLTLIMTSPYAFTEEELKMMEKDYKKPKVWKTDLLRIAVTFCPISRPRNGSCQRRRKGPLGTLSTRGERWLLGTSRGCPRRSQNFCKSDGDK